MPHHATSEERTPVKNEKGLTIVDTKTCPRCAVVFERVGLRNRDWQNRKYCTRTCGHAASGDAKRLHWLSSEKTCAFCAATITRRKGEDGQSWRKRQTCGHSCAAHLRQARKA